MEPLSRKEQGNGQGAAGGGSRREEVGRTTAATKQEQLRQVKTTRTIMSFQSSGFGEEDAERRGKEKRRQGKERMEEHYPGARTLPVGMEGWKEQGGRSTIGDKGGLRRTTAPPFRSSSLMPPRVSKPVSDLRPGTSGTM